MGIDDESSHPELCSEVADGVTRNIVGLFREPDAGNLPVRFDEREQETEPSQTGLRRARRKPRPIATGRLKPLRLFSTLPSNPKRAPRHWQTNPFVVRRSEAPQTQLKPWGAPSNSLPPGKLPVLASSVREITTVNQSSQLRQNKQWSESRRER